MKIDTNTIVSITEANRNFSRVTRLVDSYGAAVILKNNVPKYLVIDFDSIERDGALPEEFARAAEKAGMVASEQAV